MPLTWQWNYIYLKDKGEVGEAISMELHIKWTALLPATDYECYSSKTQIWTSNQKNIGLALKAV